MNQEDLHPTIFAAARVGVAALFFAACTVPAEVEGCGGGPECGVCGRCEDGHCQYDAEAAAQPSCVAEREDPCDGQDDDGDGVIDEAPTCWTAVHAFVGPTGARCFGVDARLAPEGCAGFKATRAPAFWLASHPIARTIAVRQCSFGEDHVLIGDQATATEGYAGPAVSEPAEGWEALGYACGDVLGYAWGDAPELAGAAAPVGRPCRIIRHVRVDGWPEQPLGVHEVTLGDGDATPGARCERRQRYFALSEDPGCESGAAPAACALPVCAPRAAGVVVDRGDLDPVVAPNEPFTHTFRVRNTGQVPWTPGWVITPEGPENAGAGPIPLGETVEVGAETTLAVTATAPLVGVDVHDDWALRPSAGAPVVVPLPFVFDVATADTASLRWILPNTGFVEPTDNYFHLEVALANTGDNGGWAGDWALVRDEGVVTRTARVPLPTTMNPGFELVFRIPAISPTLPGTYRERWHLERPDGTVAPIDGAAGFTHDVQVASEDVALLVAETIPDGTPLDPGTPFLKTWRVRNAGATAWGAGWSLRHRAGPLARTERVAIDAALDPGEDWLLVVPLRVPDGASDGGWFDAWELRLANGRLITVVSARGDGARALHDVTAGAPGRVWLWARIDRAPTCAER